MNNSELTLLFGLLLNQMSCQWKSLDYEEFLTVQETILGLIEVFSEEIRKHPDRKLWPNENGTASDLPAFLDLIKDYLKTVRQTILDQSKTISRLQKEQDSMALELHQYQKEVKKLQEKTSSLTTEVLSLKRSLAKAEHQKDSAKEKLKEEKKKARQARKLARQQAKEIAEQEAQKQAETADNAQSEEISRLKDEQEISALEKKLDHTNTSNSSSQYPNHKGVFPERESSGKSRGAQKGHQGAGRKVHIPATFEFLPDPKEVQEHPEDYKEIKTNIHNSTDVVLKVETTGIVQKVFRNIHTGQIVKTPFPKDLQNEENYGPSLKSLVFILAYLDNVSFDKIKELIGWMTSQEIRVSKGFIDSLGKVFSSRTRQDRIQIVQDLMSGTYIGQDFSHVRVGRRKGYASIYTNGNSVLVQFRWHKGLKGFMGGPLKIDRMYKGDHYKQEGWDGTVVGDHDQTFKGITSRKQECLIHIIRELKKSLLFDPKCIWAKKMLAFIKELTKQTEYGIAHSPEKIQEYKAEFDQILKEAGAEYPNGNPGPLSKKHVGWKLYHRMDEKPGDYLRFLDEPMVPYHNQGCELVARQLKRRVKTTDGFRSGEGARTYMNNLSVLETAKKRGLNLFDMVKSVFEREQLY